MDTIGSSVPEPLAEVRVDVSSEGTVIDKASQDSSRPTSSEDYQGNMIQSKIKEGTAFNQASQDGGRLNLFEVYQRIRDQSKAKAMQTPVVNEKYRPLFVAAQKGDWKTVEKILNKDHEAMEAEVMTVVDRPFTVIDVAIGASQYQLVKELINRSPPGLDLEVRLPLAASEGGIKMVKELLKKVDAEPESVCRALLIATRHAPKQKEVIWYLAKRTNPAPSNDIMSSDIMPRLIKAGHLDIALYLAHQCPGSASNIDLLKCLATMKSNFRSGVRLTFWEKFIDKFLGIPLCLVDTSFDNSTETKTQGGTPASKRFKISLPNYATKSALLIKRVGLRHKCSLEFANLVLTKMKAKDCTETRVKPEDLSEIVFDAASCGISEIVKLCFEHFPELTWNTNFTEQLMKKVVKGRNVELFRLVNSPSTIPLLTDEMRKELMKTVVEWSPKCQPTDVCGAPFLMQRELQWFKVLDDASDPSSKILKIERWFPNGINPISKSLNWDNFVENRRQLLKEAGQWMKDTSSSCILVSTLIITVAFGAAFQLPGGNNDDGKPKFLEKGTFLAFVIADALALFSSVTATLMFLGILTSRHMAEDFLHSLPTKMILGLTFLFLSLAFMLVSFGSAFTIVLSDKFRGIYTPITLLAAIPVILFAILHTGLYFEMIVSTYWPRLYRPLKLWE